MWSKRSLGRVRAYLMTRTVICDHASNLRCDPAISYPSILKRVKIEGI